MMNKEHVSGLDGLRAIAILGVVFYHMIPNTVPGGYLGVNLFFVIMGYLMVFPAKRDGKAIEKAWVYEGNFGGTVSFAVEYYKKKIKRLYPPLLVMMSLSIAALLLLVPEYAKGMFPEVASILLGYNNWWQIAQNASYFERMLNSSPFTHLWYLGLTVQYYLIYPLLFVAGYCMVKKSANKDTAKAALAGACFFAAVLSALEMAFLYDPAVDPSRLYYGTDTRAFSLLIGLAIGLLPAKKLTDGVMRILIRIAVFALLGIIVIAYFTVTGESAENYHYQMQLTALAFGFLVLAVLSDQDGLGEWADVYPLQKLGKYSYEVYLVMYPVIFFVQKKLPGLDTFVYVAVCVIGIAAAAAVVHGIPALWGWFKNAHIEGVWLPRLAGALLVIICLGLTGFQTYVAQAHGGTDDMVALEEELKQNAMVLSGQEAAAKKTALLTQLASVNTTVETQATIITDAAGTRKSSNADAAAAALAKSQEEAAMNMVTVPASVSVTAIGDSVMLGASGALQAQIPGIYVSAAVSRQVTAGPGIMQDLSVQGLLSDILVVHLGTNGVSTLNKYQDIVDTAGPDAQIFWVNCVGPAWAADVNKNISAVCANNPNVTLVEWTSVAEGHPNYFGSDGIHLTESGKKAYANMIANAIGGE
ncbi:MAG: acetyltransferase [Lachnospiraceae bacterium]|nr:acetyltransferase [Lachnospiraceae bacterium]